ncbi:MAG: hypothetical protein PHD43_23905 [Methylococcales bacterium]|nr:hypothetical protein [Methylococcales bacterium]
MEEEVSILEEEVVKECGTCGVRFGSGKRSTIVGKQQAQRERMILCVSCEYNPSRAILANIGMSTLADRVVGEAVDNWRPISDEDKSCQTCKTGRELIAIKDKYEFKRLMRERCASCRYSVGARIVGSTKTVVMERMGDKEPTEDHWENFEG